MVLDQRAKSIEQVKVVDLQNMSVVELRLGEVRNWCLFTTIVPASRYLVLWRAQLPTVLCANSVGSRAESDLQMLSALITVDRFSALEETTSMLAKLRECRYMPLYSVRLYRPSSWR